MQKLRAVNRAPVGQLAAITAILAIGAAGWAFFAFGGTKQPAGPAAAQEILTVQDKRFTKGNPDAPVRIIEYIDLLCPYCAKTNTEVIPHVQADYIDAGKVHYEVRLVGIIAPDSMRAAEGAYCAAEHGKFWEYVDTAYSDTWNTYYSQNKEPSDVSLFNGANINSFARRIGITDSLENTEWQQCVDEHTYNKMINQNKADMSEMEAYGTPHFIINGKGYNGSPPYAILKATIDAALNEQKAEDK